MVHFAASRACFWWTSDNFRRLERFPMVDSFVFSPSHNSRSRKMAVDRTISCVFYVLFETVRRFSMVDGGDGGRAGRRRWARGLGVVGAFNGVNDGINFVRNPAIYTFFRRASTTESSFEPRRAAACSSPHGPASAHLHRTTAAHHRSYTTPIRSCSTVSICPAFTCTRASVHSEPSSTSTACTISFSPCACRMLRASPRPYIHVQPSRVQPELATTDPRSSRSMTCEPEPNPICTS
ncbi:phosphatidylinositolN-acetylglucosaminyltransferase subunit C [Striga asiatica]|uniref:PhosphatidylinositolN-acetylglucosaminyltransferase subunit C n=1 Tax=Striga asiatica TaxID=4170 RepID=A0A5A7P3P4_STRAF|nr:phosphatidylinositolN-acetylglucosaminyltransferase subunit C [Striga asiatica]